jgi:anti-sigma regulatory factor (Ser/Thr protein kinase)
LTRPSAGRHSGVSDNLTLAVPPDAAFMATARLFAAAVARHYGVEEELIPDLKLAISEACAGEILTGTGESDVRISATPEGQRIRFEVTQPPESRSPSAVSEVTPSPAETAGLGLEVIKALFADAEVVNGPDGGRLLRFGAPIPSGAGSA